MKLIGGLKTQVYRELDVFVCMLIFYKFFFCSGVLGNGVFQVLRVHLKAPVRKGRAFISWGSFAAFGRADGILE